ncbi:hypothetical protein H1D24_38120 [Streptomyces sp. PSKA28]|uniref:Uncharacterized protein n=1 Tax=Streptomyces himalayensis subsp. himalayensis TaxID=2756131 RepID=A0A7W0IDU8_9ACTN|nr:hypothetical protein [Streptomyces himalayensis subsp. himalayensis]
MTFVQAIQCELVRQSRRYLLLGEYLDHDLGVSTQPEQVPELQPMGVDLAMDALRDGALSDDEPGLLQPLIERALQEGPGTLLLEHDPAPHFVVRQLGVCGLDDRARVRGRLKVAGDHRAIPHPDGLRRGVERRQAIQVVRAGVGALDAPHARLVGGS